MICELRVKNLALIEGLNLQFAYDNSGSLVVMTGETGAGKSIMLRAIHLLSGRRSSADWVRSGAELCEVEALFEIDSEHRAVFTLLERGGFGTDSLVTLKRSLSSDGRSRCYINGSFATAKTLAELAGELFTVASQHDQQQLLQEGLHLDFLDTVAGLWPDRQGFEKVFLDWKSKKNRLDELRQREREKLQREDFLRFQVAEIREAEIFVGEDEQLVEEKNRLKNLQQLINLGQDSYRLLSGELQDGLVQLRQNIVRITELDPSIGRLAEDITDFTFLAEDFVARLLAYRDGLSADPHRLDAVSERLDLLQKLKRKFAGSIEEILSFAKNGEAELLQLEQMDQEIENLEKEVTSLWERACTLATDLSEKRQGAAVMLERAMVEELSSLAFDRPLFTVDWASRKEDESSLLPSGWDRVAFYFSANYGEEPRPLAKIASGGELSRMMLAMKCLLAKKDMVKTVFFDEVDAGIGGEAAEAVARKIQELSGHHQVFCITHLPQIAARGGQHFYVAKGIENGRTKTSVKKLTAGQRRQEIVRMLAGDSATEQTLAWADDLLAKGEVGR